MWFFVLLSLGLSVRWLYQSLPQVWELLKCVIAGVPMRDGDTIAAKVVAGVSLLVAAWYLTAWLNGFGHTATMWDPV